MQAGRQPLGLTDWILCEVLQGVRGDREFEAVRRSLLRFAIFDSGGASLAIAAARHYRTLRAQGRTVRKTADCWIATFCLEHDYALLHRDRDFEHFEIVLGLRVIHA